MRVIGIDEAGYGPMLGPLVVASVSIECGAEGYDPEALWRALGSDAGIADSKVVLSHRDMASGEEATLAVLALAGIEPSTRRELFEGVVVPSPSLDDDVAADVSSSAWSCDESSAAARESCVPDEQQLPRWGKGPLDERIADLRHRLVGAGVTLSAARAVAMCPAQLNRAVTAGMSKLLVDWKLFCHLLKLDRSALAPDGYAACGKLGGRSKYGALLMDLDLSSVIEESRPLSAYHVAGLGRVDFIRHAEAAHAPVAMASMIAKVVREHLLDQWHLMLAGEVPELDRCSGYHEPVTKRYVAKTADARASLQIPERCFIRVK